MNWQIPTKTFLIGEYAALRGSSALVITTTPLFELSLCNQTDSNPLHPASPAGRWWQQQDLSQGLVWKDPFEGRGGLGASSAQFLSVYLAACALNQKSPSLNNMLEIFYKVAWTGIGLRPSAYDVIAQSQQGCVFINKQKNIIQTYLWPFNNLSFFLIHTGLKLATHHHLQEITLPQDIHLLSNIVDKGHEAFKQNDDILLLDCINLYHRKLDELQLVARHSLDLIHALQNHSEVLAIKGCGALGADVLLLVCARANKNTLKNKLLSQNLEVLATESELNNCNKLLEVTETIINTM